MNDDTGALGPSGRFARMEAALERIELKLDLKADLTRVAEVEGRITSLERTFNDAMSGRTQSPLGQLYLERFNTMNSTIEVLERKEADREAVMAAQQQEHKSRYSILLWVVGVVTVVQIAISMMVLLLGQA